MSFSVGELTNYNRCYPLDATFAHIVMGLPDAAVSKERV